MTAYRTYRGLYGETIRVPEHTIVPTPRTHSSEPFPFVALAERLGRVRNKVAAIGLHHPLIEDTLRQAAIGSMLADEERYKNAQKSEAA